MTRREYRYHRRRKMLRFWKRKDEQKRKWFIDNLMNKKITVKI